MYWYFCADNLLLAAGIMRLFISWFYSAGLNWVQVRVKVRLQRMDMLMRVLTGVFVLLVSTISCK